jgi:DNA-binding CsgD family transcriptional regulator
MKRRTSKNPSKSNLYEGVLSEQLPHLLLAAFARSETIGFAVCDQLLRFQLVNEAWATMYGGTREAHLGATIGEVLGPAAGNLEMVFKQVFLSGESLLDQEFSGKLRTRTEEGYWITSCFPLRATHEKLKLAAAVVLETTQLRSLENWSRKLLSDSARLIEGLFAGDQFLSASLIGTAGPGTATKGLRSDRISPREREVIQLLASSKGNKEVAAALGISVRTIETYRTRIMLKLRIHSMSELVHYAIRNGIVEP